jgi:hypothetical protein
MNADFPEKDLLRMVFAILDPTHSVQFDCTTQSGSAFFPAMGDPASRDTTEELGRATGEYCFSSS